MLLIETELFNNFVIKALFIDPEYKIIITKHKYCTVIDCSSLKEMMNKYHFLVDGLLNEKEM